MEDSDQRSLAEDDYLLEEVLCVHCLEVIPYEANLCGHCKAPQNFLAATLPYERIHAEGFILRTAAEGTRSWLVLVGIWLLYGPTVVVMILLVVIAVQLRGEGVAFFGGIEVFTVAAWGVPGFLLVLRTTFNFVRKRRAGDEGGGDRRQSK